MRSPEDFVPVMRRAIELAATVSYLTGANPRVGCVLIDDNGALLGEGYHRGVGTDHAEVAALSAAGGNAEGATAVVTLEPCNHTGRTGPCTEVLIAAGVKRVVYACDDPNPQAGGGADRLRAAGIAVHTGILAAEAAALNLEWMTAVERQRPFVTVKTATTLDGRVAAADGSSRWITGAAARDDVHELRGRVDAVITGTGTVLADDPQLTDRRRAANRQPVRIVVGEQAIPDDARILDDSAPTRVLATRDLHVVLASLYAEGMRHVMVEAGPGLVTAFLREGLVDRIRWYIAPVVLGAGATVVDDLGISTMGEALRLTTESVERIGDDVRIDVRV